jgi:hypothetical protein
MFLKKKETENLILPKISQPKNDDGKNIDELNHEVLSFLCSFFYSSEIKNMKRHLQLAHFISNITLKTNQFENFVIL